MFDKIERSSLCVVSEEDCNGQIWLQRLADVTNGTLNTFIFNEYASRFFDNRDRLYWRDGPKVKGYIGVWDWTAIPNRNDPDKDYVETSFNSEEQPIEIIRVEGINTLEDLITSLRSGLKANLCGCRTLFVFSDTRVTYKGVLCDLRDVLINEEKVTLNDDVVFLPVYEISSEKVFRVYGRLFYRYLNIETFERKIIVKDPIEIVKNAILERTTWKVFKSRNMTKVEWREVYNFLESIKDDSLYQEIAYNCNCSETEAKEYIDSFVRNAEKFIKHEDIDSEILTTLVESNPLLLQRCEAIVEKEWKTSHESEIDKANKDLIKIMEEVEKNTNRHNILIKKIEAAEKVLNEKLAEIADYEKLGKDVTQKVQEEIINARNNAAEFISKMLFTYSKDSKENTSSGNKGEQAYSSGLNLEKDLEPFTLYEELIDSYKENLQEAGVANNYSFAVAAFIYSSYINRVPIFLSGPCGENIANAFSVTLCGRTAAVLDCSQDYSSVSLQMLLDSDDEIVIIKNPFSAKWINRIPELLLQGNKYYFVVSPYAEDLTIEPRSLYNYVLPVLTEVFVENISTNNFEGGYIDANFEEFEAKNTDKPCKRQFAKLSMSRMSSFRFGKVLADTYELVGRKSADIDFALVLFPYAFVTNQLEVFADILKEDASISKTLRAYILSFIGEEE